MSFKEVTSLRKAGRLQDAYNMAKADLEQEQSKWTYSAMFWVLSDYGKQYIAQGQQDKARECLDEMINLLEGMDDNEGYAEKAINYLHRQLTPHWSLVYNMSELSKAGDVEEAYEKLTEVHGSTPFDTMLHEDFGWVIFRYLNKKYEEIGSVNSRRALLTYIELKNDRPSLLHSQMLNVATKVSEKYEDFKFLPFFKMWGVSHFSDDDYFSSNLEGKEISPLVNRIIERCFKLGYSLEEVQSAFEGNSRVQSVEYIFSRFCFFEITRLYKGELSPLFDFINKYLDAISGKEVKNDYHSKILSIILKKLPEERTSEFLSLFEKWGFNHFMENDWKREKYEDKDIPSLVEKAVSRYVKALKAQQYRDVNDTFLELLKEAIDKYPDHDQLERNLALIKIAQGEKEEALVIYRKLVLKLNKFYIWKELADATEDKNLKISALCKAILSEPKDEFLGDVHLSLAKLLIEEELFDVAKQELNTFKDTYQTHEWKPKEDYYILSRLIPHSVEATGDNRRFYTDHLLPAEEFVYSDIEWTTMVVSDIFVQEKNGKKIEKAKLVSADGVEISVRLNVLKEKKNKLIGKCYDVKLITQDDRYRIGLIKKSAKDISEILSSVVCYVDYHNQERKCYHLISQKNKQLILKQGPQLKEGQFCSCYVVPQKEVNKDKPAQAIFCKFENTESAVHLFPCRTAVVDNVNDAKQLFHCVMGRGITIIIRFAETDIRPKVGDCVKIHYIWKKRKDDSIMRKMLLIEHSETNITELKKTIMGTIRLNVNHNGQPFGFVEDYYIPANLINNIENGDTVKIDVVFDGEKWKAYQLNKIE